MIASSGSCFEMEVENVDPILVRMWHRKIVISN